jgi:hypothetical protein
LIASLADEFDPPETREPPETGDLEESAAENDGAVVEVAVAAGAGEGATAAAAAGCIPPPPGGVGSVVGNVVKSAF